MHNIEHGFTIRSWVARGVSPLPKLMNESWNPWLSSMVSRFVHELRRGVLPLPKLMNESWNPWPSSMVSRFVHELRGAFYPFLSSWTNRVIHGHRAWFHDSFMSCEGAFYPFLSSWTNRVIHGHRAWFHDSFMSCEGDFFAPILPTEMGIQMEIPTGFPNSTLYASYSACFNLSLFW